MKLYPKMVLVLTVLFSLIALSGVVFAQDKFDDYPLPRVVTDRPLKVAYCRDTLAWASGIRPYIQLQIEEKIRDWEVTYVTDILEPVKQREAVENLIVKNVDALIISDFQVDQFPDLIERARDKGIGIYCVDTSLVPGVIANTTLPNGVFSSEMTYWGVDKLKGQGGFALIGWELTDWGIERTFPIKILMEVAFPRIDFLAYDTTSVDKYVDDAFQITSGWLQKFGKKLNWIHTPFDGIAMPVVRAVEQAGYTRDELMVTGIDAGIEAMQLIKEGTPMAATYGQFFEAYIHYTCDMIQQIQVDGIMPGDPRSIVPLSGIMRFPGMMVTADNLPEEGSTAYELHDYDGLDPDDPEAWVNWYKKVGIEPYRYDYPKN